MKHLSFYAYNHQGKGKKYIDALISGDMKQTFNTLEANIIITDLDDPSRMERVDQRTRVFCYPHSAVASIIWDSLYEAHPKTAACFMPSKGHIDIMQAYGYSKPIHVSGFPYCDFKPFEPNEHPRNVLFAPIHPNMNSFLSEIDRRINSSVYQRLLYLLQNDCINLTVRHIGSLEKNGLWLDERVTFKEGKTDLSFIEIDNADIVVSHHTHAHMAIARGKPVLMMGEDIAPRYGGTEESLRFVKSWDKYKDMLMYPLDILNANDTMSMIVSAAKGRSPIVQDWIDRIIGDPFQPDEVVKVVKNYYQ